MLPCPESESYPILNRYARPIVQQSVLRRCVYRAILTQTDSGLEKSNTCANSEALFWAVTVSTAQDVGVHTPVGHELLQSCNLHHNTVPT